MMPPLDFATMFIEGIIGAVVCLCLCLLFKKDFFWVSSMTGFLSIAYHLYSIMYSQMPYTEKIIATFSAFPLVLNFAIAEGVAIIAYAFVRSTLKRE